jgi:hypothetical protein
MLTHTHAHACVMYVCSVSFLLSLTKWHFGAYRLKSPFLQIVNGVMYHLQLRVGTTSCSENGASKPDCMKHYSSPVKICKVELHRSFTDNSHLDAKVSIT